MGGLESRSSSLISVFILLGQPRVILPLAMSGDILVVTNRGEECHQHLVGKHQGCF